MGQKVTIDVEARFIDNVSGEAGAASSAFKKVETTARAAAKEVDELGKKNPKPKVDANTTPAMDKLNKTEKKLDKLGKAKTDVKLDAQDRATSKIVKVLNKLKSYAKNPKAAVLDAKDWATAKITKALNAARRFAGKTYSATVKIRDSEALSSLRKITSGGEKIAGKTWSAVVKVKDLATAPLRGIKNLLFSIKTLAATIVAGVVAKKTILEPLNLADSYSSAKIGFSTLLGESAGQQMMDDLDAFAKKTPFKTSGVIDSARKMMAMGWDSENLLADLEVFGNAAAATGNLDQGLESIVRAMSQIKTKGRLSTEELNQLAEAGIAAKQMLAEGLGYGTGDEGIAKMTEDLEKGAIASNVAIEALIAGMKKYDGMMDSMANETAEGLMSQIQDTFEINVVRKWGQGLQDGAKRGLGTVVEMLDEAEGALSKFGDMMYELGEKASNWLADKLENAFKRIKEITGSYEFDQASLGEKISMLWKGVVVDPIKEWFSNLWTDPENIEKATAFGQSFAEALTKGIMAILGITDIFADTGDGAESKGSNIAQGFAKGFVDGFDVSAITGKIVDAIGNVWSALPTWAKILVGGYAAGKVAGGIGSFIGGVATFGGHMKNIIGTTGKVGADGVMAGSGLLGMIGSANKMTGLMGLGVKTSIGLGLGNLAGGASWGAGALAATGLAGLAGGAAGLVSTGKGLYDAYGSYKAFKEGDDIEGSAKAASSISTLGGVASGAAMGFAVGGPLGALIGAGIGGVAGWWGGNKAANDIRQAKYETEGLAEAMEDAETEAQKLEAFNAAKWEVAKKTFGDIELSMDEISRLSQQVVWGDDLPKYEAFASAAKQAAASLENLNAAGQQTDRWMWKAKLGVKFNEDEVESIKASFDSYINSAKQYVEDKHYEFTASADIILDLESETGKSILESGNAYYAEVQEKLNTLGEELSSTLDTVLKDGVISTTDTVKIKIGDVEYELNEQDAVAKLQAEIAKITKQIADAEADAELALIELKFGDGKLTQESFDSFLATTQENLDSRLSSADASLKAQISNLNLRFPKEKRNSEQYKKELQALIDGYNLEVETITADVLGVELEILGDVFSGEDALGEDAIDDLNNIINKCIEDGITPADLKLEDIIELSGNPELSDEKASLIQDYLTQIFDQLDLSQFELVEVDGKVKLKLKTEVETDEGTEGKVKESVDGQVPDTVEETVKVNIKLDKIVETIEAVTEEDFELPESVDSSVIVKINAAETVEEQIEILASEFGIPESVAEEVLVKLTGKKEITETVVVTAEELCPTDSVTKEVTVNIKPVANYLTGEGGYNVDFFRGGIAGGTSAMAAFARGGIAGKVAGNIPGFSDGGMVRGGSQLIEVAEEGSPEMIIPLSSQRRGRALKLWAQAGNIMGVPGFARGGVIGGNGSSDEGIRFHTFGGGESAGGQTVQIEVGGITVEIHVNATGKENIAAAIKEQAAEIAETVAGIMVDALGGQFENTPLRGGAA